MEMVNLADAVRAIQSNSKLSDFNKELFRTVLGGLPCVNIVYCKDCAHRTRGMCSGLVPGRLVTTAENFHCAYGRER